MGQVSGGSKKGGSHMKKIEQILKDWATARNGVDFSFTKLLGMIAGAVLVYKFLSDPSSDYIGFASGVSLIMAALAAKYLVEGKK